MDNEIIAGKLASMDTKLDMLLAFRTDHETRIRGLEASQWKHTGAMLVATPFLAYFGPKLAKLGFNV